MFPKSRQVGLEKHKMREHSTEDSFPNSFPCTKCGKQFFRSYQLLDHTRRTHVASCSKCTETFTTIRLLRKHELDHMEGEKIQCSIFYCHYCMEQDITSKRGPGNYHARRYRNANKLKSHIQTHTGERLFCRHCGTGCDTYKELVAHNKTYHGETLKFTCEKCEFRTQSLSIISKHNKNLHDGNAISCSVDGCDYSCFSVFTTIYREFTCDIKSCQYKTSRKPDLKVHNENIHLKIKHKCEDCGLEMTTRSNTPKHCA